MRFQAVLKEFNTQVIEALARAIEEDDIIWAMEPEILHGVSNPLKESLEAGNFLDFAEDVMQKMSSGSPIVIDFEADERDGDGAEVYPRKLMAAVKNSGGHYIYLNEGESTSRGQVPAFVLASLDDLGETYFRVTPASDGWEAVVAPDATESERNAAIRISEIIKQDEWLVTETAVSMKL